MGLIPGVCNTNEEVTKIAAAYDEGKYDSFVDKLGSCLPKDDNGDPDWSKFGEIIADSVTALSSGNEFSVLFQNSDLLGIIFQYIAKTCDSITKAKDPLRLMAAGALLAKLKSTPLSFILGGN